ncbi:MAG: hypothetical protein SO314_01860 [Alphaproteobacteria bacterium]|nr:hypothetical protein [Alphaproteobacteria bacterium]
MEDIKKTLEEVFIKSSVLAGVKLAADAQSRDLFNLNSTRFVMLFGKKAYREIEYWFDEEEWDNLDIVLKTFSRKNMWRLLKVSDCLAGTPDAISEQISILYVRTCQMFIQEERVWEEDRTAEFIGHISKKLMNPEIDDIRPKKMFAGLALNLTLSELSEADGAIDDYLRSLGIDPDMIATLVDGINRINLN